MHSAARIAMMGLSIIADANPNWEKSPLLARLLGKPKFRYWRYADASWVYSETKPVATFGGIDRTSNTMWRTGNTNA